MVIVDGEWSSSSLLFWVCATTAGRDFHHVKRSAVFQNEPFTIPNGKINHLCRHWNKRMLTIVQTPFTANVLLDGFLSLMKSLSLTIWSPFPSIYFGLGPLLKTPITAVVLNGFLSLMKGLSLTAWLPFPSFFWTWCNNRSCQARLRPSNRGRWFFVQESFFRRAHLYEKSTKHCPHGSISCVNNANTGIPTLIS
jgi:hypothetical protein